MINTTGKEDVYREASTGVVRMPGATIAPMP